MGPTRLHLSDSALRILDTEMPPDTLIYITVRAFNRVGLSSERSSDGFQIDITPPNVMTPPTIDNTKGVIVDGTQVNSKYFKGSVSVFLR